MIVLAAMVWMTGTSHEAVNRGRAAMQADDLPRAIMVFRMALRETPTDGELQQDLLLARSLVDAPHPSLTGWHYQLSNRTVFIAFTILAIATLISSSLYFTSRPRGAGSIAALALSGLIAVAGVQYCIDREMRMDRALPFAICTIDCSLYEGNASSFPVVKNLPRGAEVNILHERGTWVHAELAEGTRGWIEKTHLLYGDSAANQAGH